MQFYEKAFFHLFKFFRIYVFSSFAGNRFAWSVGQPVENSTTSIMNELTLRFHISLCDADTERVQIRLWMKVKPENLLQILYFAQICPLRLSTKNIWLLLENIKPCLFAWKQQYSDFAPKELLNWLIGPKLATLHRGSRSNEPQWQLPKIESPTCFSKN